MTNRAMKLNISEQTQAAYDSLEEQDRRWADELFERLRNWHVDPTIRTESELLSANDNAIKFRLDSDVSANFELAGDTIIVLSVEHNAHREESRKKATEIKAAYEWARQQPFSVEEFEAGMRDIQENGGVEFHDIIQGINEIFSGVPTSKNNGVGSVPKVEGQISKTDG